MRFDSAGYEAPSNQKPCQTFFFLQTGISIVVLFDPPFDFSKKKSAAPHLEKHFLVSPHPLLSQTEESCKRKKRGIWDRLHL
jgi:hypothetical protein